MKDRSEDLIKKEKKKDLDLKSNELKDEESCNDLLQEPEKGLNENELLATKNNIIDEIKKILK